MRRDKCHLVIATRQLATMCRVSGLLYQSARKWMLVSKPKPTVVSSNELWAGEVRPDLMVKWMAESRYGVVTMAPSKKANDEVDNAGKFRPDEE